jgi:lipopolysaccharide transport system permease protein
MQHAEKTFLAKDHRQAFDLLFQVAMREISARYRGAILGLFASLINPLMMLGAYAVVFGWVFNGHYYLKPSETRADYVTALFSGLVIFNYFAECLSRAPTLILANPNYVKKVVFPLELIPVSANVAALFHLGISAIPLVGAIVFFGGGLNPGAAWAVMILIPLVFLAQGVLWMLAAFGVFIRDLGLLIGTLTQILMFGSAIFYRIGSLPEPFRNIISFNPLAQIIEMARGALIAGIPPDLRVFGLVLVVSIFFCALAFECFKRCRPAFADVI